MSNSIYFLIATYFQFWARFVLKRWNPIIIAVIGSAGKTSTLSLIDQIFAGQNIKVSHKTNAVTAIPLDILDLHQKSFSPTEWLQLFFQAPIKAFTINHKQAIYLCEMDSDRVGEMQAHTKLIQPHITCWVSAYACHTQNFPGESSQEILKSLLDDLGYAIQRNNGLILANGDETTISSQLKRSVNPIGLINLSASEDSTLILRDYHVSLSGTQVSFRLNLSNFKNLYHRLYPHQEFNPSDFPPIINLTFPYAILSRVNMYGLGIAILIALLLGYKPKQIIDQLKNWRLPPGRMSLFAGIKTTTIIDSTYNASKVATIDAIQILNKLGGHKTIAILGDMRELGKLSQAEHLDLAKTILTAKIRRVILIGPNMNDYVYSYLVKHGYLENRTIFKTLDPQWAADLVKSQDFLRVGETILVKGSQNTLFLEGIVEQLLASQKDKKNLCRREAIWEKKRSQIYKSTIDD